MIVYNVQRRWFAMKADAEAYRKSLGLPLAATTQLRIETREELAALLSELCEPGSVGPMVENVVPAVVVDRAYVVPDKDIPKFLRESWAKMFPQDPRFAEAKP